jgi:ubiquinone/menaquinone biosynthesis C-methylase UbiE
MSATQRHLVVAHFDKVAPQYASFYVGDRSEAHSFSIRLERVIELLPEKFASLLDLGCGPGLLLQRLAPRKGAGGVRRLTGLDFAHGMLQQAQQGAQPGAYSVLRGDVAKLPFGAINQDVVVCMGLMEYLDDERAVLAEIARVMRPGGTVIITLPNVSSLYRRWHRLLNRMFLRLRRWFPRSQRLQNLEFMVGPFTKGIAHREYAEEAYRRLLREYGLDVVATCYYNFKIFLTPLDKVFPRLTVQVSRGLERLGRGRTGRLLATAFIVRAEKTS